MTSSAATHRAEQHRSSRPGVEAITLQSDRSFPRHAHDQYGIGLLSFGAHRTWSAIGPVQAEAGDVITVNPGEMHDGAPVDGRSRGWRMLYFEPDLVAAELGEAARGTPEISRPALRDGALRSLIERLFAQVTHSRPEALQMEEDLLRTLMLVFRRYGARPVRPLRSSPCVSKALRRLDDHPQAPVSLAELSALSGVGRFQLLRGFAREVGTTPHAYLVQQRVRIARQRLARGDTPAQAANEAGFADQSHMTRAFVRQLGVTPARYSAAVA